MIDKPEDMDDARLDALDDLLQEARAQGAYISTRHADPFSIENNKAIVATVVAVVQQLEPEQCRACSTIGARK
jgi:hypothetical protein